MIWTKKNAINSSWLSEHTWFTGWSFNWFLAAAAAVAVAATVSAVVLFIYHVRFVEPRQCCIARTHCLMIPIPITYYTNIFMTLFDTNAHAQFIYFHCCCCSNSFRFISFRLHFLFNFTHEMNCNICTCSPKKKTTRASRRFALQPYKYNAKSMHYCLMHRET